MDWELPKIPRLFYGTFKVFDELEQCLDAAVESGFRGIDTAACYKNEVNIGQCYQRILARHNLNRQDVFITTKLNPRDAGQLSVPMAVCSSLSNLSCSYIDAYLIHWPGVSKAAAKRLGLANLDNLEASGAAADVRRTSWQELENMVMQANKIENKDDIETKSSYRPLRSIGVSNYTVRHIEELAGYATIKPILLQNEFHPYLGDNTWASRLRKALALHFPATIEEVSTDRKDGDSKYSIPSYAYAEPVPNSCVVFQAYSPLANGQTDLLTGCQIIQSIATKRECTTAEVVLKWSLQKGNSVVVKSSSPSRIRCNAQTSINSTSWSLSEEEMCQIDTLDTGTHVCWNPENC